MMAPRRVHCNHGVVDQIENSDRRMGLIQRVRDPPEAGWLAMELA